MTNQTEQNSPNITQMALVVARNTQALIDALSMRGAFRGEDLEHVGRLRTQCMQLSNLCDVKIEQDRQASEKTE